MFAEGKITNTVTEHVRFGLRIFELTESRQTHAA